MPTQVNIVHKPDDPFADEIRILFCKEAASAPISGRNPLISTQFNEYLDKIAQLAFEAGLRFAKNNPTMVNYT